MFTVTRRAMRPATKAEECFYCKAEIGGTHAEDCVLVHRKVKVRMTVEYEISVPAHWTPAQIEWHRNDGSWCADNAFVELEALSEEHGCLCHCTHFTYLEDTSSPYLEE